MQVLLKEALSILKGDLTAIVIESGTLSAPVERLCQLMSFVSCEKCETQALVDQTIALARAKPGWYVNIRGLIDSLKLKHGVNGTVPLLEIIDADFPGLMIELEKCPLHPKGGKRAGAGAKKREHRKVLYKNVPESLFDYLKSFVDKCVSDFVVKETEQMGRKVVAVEPKALVNLPPCPYDLAYYRNIAKWDTLTEQEQEWKKKAIGFSVSIADDEWKASGGTWSPEAEKEMQRINRKRAEAEKEGEKI